MKAGEFPNGARVLRAKIDMASGNINLRDPVLYRILKAPHPRTGTTWSIYPSYDFAHGQSDAIEGITHSICTLEFEDHRPLYDWFLANLPVPSKPHQYEFARLNLTYTVLSKRVLTTLVRDGHVKGWDDPRMPTLAGLRRRGVPPGRDPRFRQADRRRQGQQRRRRQHARLLDPRGAEQDRAAADGGAASAQGGDRELSEGPGRGARRGQPSGQSGRRLPQDQVRPRALHRARRLHGEPAEEVLPAVARHRGAAALRLFHHLPRGGEERRRRGGRAALHLRSGDPRRQRPGRPQGQGDDPLGVGQGFQARRGAHLQSAVHQARSDRRRGLYRRPQSAVAGGAERRPRRAGAGGGEQFSRAGAVRAAGLFRPRPGFDARPSGVQPHRRIA